MKPNEFNTIKIGHLLEQIDNPGVTFKVIGKTPMHLRVVVKMIGCGFSHITTISAQELPKYKNLGVQYGILNQNAGELPKDNFNNGR